MLSSVLSQQHPTTGLSGLAAKDTTVSHHPHDLVQLTHEQSNLDRATMAKICESPTSWSTFPCSLWFNINAKVNVLCVNVDCDFEDERDWQGRIVGKGVHGSLNALFTRIMHKNKQQMPLIGLLTVCMECYKEGFSFDYMNSKRQINQILSSKHKRKNFGRLILGVSYKEVEEIIFSKVIIMEGVLMDTVETVSLNLKQEWDLLRPLFKG